MSAVDKDGSSSLSKHPKRSIFDLVPISESPRNEDQSPSSSIAFPDIKRKVLAELYGLDDNHTYNYQLLHDESPKGSVDEDIRPLVDLINSHPAFCTLSSCSGRIALFHPALGKRSIEDGNNNDLESDEASGKGYGQWLISSHAKITSTQLITSLDTIAVNHHEQKLTSIPTLLFKHEPLLLHVAASNLNQARQLLHIALDLGLRESGIVYTLKRITVAIRCHSLALSTPIAYTGHLRPNDDYLDGLVKEANNRFDINQQKLVSLYKNIASSFFTQVPKDVPSLVQDDCEQSSCELLIRSLPDLNLWGHAAVTLVPEIIESSGDVDIYIFGGYGVGPVLLGSSELRTGATRSSKVYRLQRRKSQWDNTWLQIQDFAWDDSTDLNQYNTSFGKLYVKRTFFTAREGLSACPLPILSPGIVAIFGGRESPLKPSNQLLLFDSGSEYVGFSEPLDISGEPPSRRWGHSLTGLSSNGNHLAIVIGGRDENDILSSAYILSIESANPQDSCKLIWSRLDVDMAIYYPSVVSFADEFKDEILVFGGLRSLNDSFLCFKRTDDTSREEPNHVDIRISLKDGCATVTRLRAQGIGFGASPFVVEPCRNTKTRGILFTGGFVSPIMDESKSLEPFIVRPWKTDFGILGPPVPVHITDVEMKGMNFGSLVHHVALKIPSIMEDNHLADASHQEFVLVGGGVPAFAFGASFAKTYWIKVRQGQQIMSSAPVMKPTREKNSVEKNDQPMTDVFYVQKIHAKQVKTALENSCFLDHRFRMTAACENAAISDPASCVAVPITKECLQHYRAAQPLAPDESRTQPCSINTTEWLKFISGYGKQSVPYSSASFCSRKTRNG